ncbi:hypothetical protein CAUPRSCDRAFT_12067 [Caulochytrium protostelioides]|uniref:Uncharacterized protein n=1 Tax=Caulochytrium protostelioides TaxID=1555241 RepID=A0A4P9WXP7_9FUNG|nr:hypothetical protein CAUPRSCDRAFT_12067 [Caulochytrium protostelioides]
MSSDVMSSRHVDGCAPSYRRGAVSPRSTQARSDARARNTVHRVVFDGLHAPVDADADAFTQADVDADTHVEAEAEAEAEAAGDVRRVSSMPERVSDGWSRDDRLQRPVTAPAFPRIAAAMQRPIPACG